MASQADLLDPQDALSEYPFPLAIVTAGRGSERAGMVAAWLTQVSWKPPYVGVAIYREWTTLKIILKYSEFALNLISEKLVDVSLKVFGSMSSRQVDKFDIASRNYGVRVGEGRHVKAPVILDAPIVIECKFLKHVEVGDHYLVIGEPVAAYRNNEDKPVIYYKNKVYSIGKEVGT